MANKKKVKSEKSSSITSGFRSIRNFLENEIFKGIIGLILIFVAGFMIYAFISFFSTSAADQSLIEAPKDGEFLNEHHEFANACGSVGAYISWYFLKCSPLLNAGRVSVSKPSTR